MEKFRQIAYSQGELTYATGRPCKRGHNGKRYTSTGSCVDCMGAASVEQAVVNRSLRINHNSRLAKDSSLYSRIAPLDWHNDLDALRDIAMYGTDEVKQHCRDFIKTMAAFPKADRDIRPRQYAETLTASDLVRIFDYKGGKSSNWQSFEYVGGDDRGHTEQYVKINAHWYSMEDVTAALTGTLTAINPTTPTN